MPAITLYIQAHGSEDIEIDYYNTQDVNLLSFAGELNSYGKGARMNGVSIDEYIIGGIQYQYKEYADNSQAKKYTSMGPYIQELYKPTRFKFGENAFTQTNPQFERTFYFEPNLHENCRSCIEKGNKKCTQLPKSEQWCPNYGLYVVCTDDPEDDGFTLATVSRENKELANILTDMTTFRHWSRKINTDNPNIISDFKNIRNRRKINLSFLIDCFESMGFDKYYILDPTCRECSTWGSKTTQAEEPEYVKDKRKQLITETTKDERTGPKKPPPSYETEYRKGPFTIPKRHSRTKSPSIEEPEIPRKMSTKDWICNAAGYCVLAAGAVAGATKMAGYWGGKTRHNKKQNRKTRRNKK